MELTFASHVENNKVCFIGKAFDIIRQQKLPDVKITEDDVINTIVKWRAVNVYKQTIHGNLICEVTFNG